MDKPGVFEKKELVWVQFSVVVLVRKGKLVLFLSLQTKDFGRREESIVVTVSHTKDRVEVLAFKVLVPHGLHLFENWQDAVNEADGTIILTEWNEFRGMDLSDLKSRMASPVVLDTKNILSIQQLQSLGFSFDNVGRTAV